LRVGEVSRCERGGGGGVVRVGGADVGAYGKRDCCGGGCCERCGRMRDAELWVVRVGERHRGGIEGETCGEDLLEARGLCCCG